MVIVQLLNRQLTIKEEEVSTYKAQGYEVVETPAKKEPKKEKKNDD